MAVEWVELLLLQVGKVDKEIARMDIELSKYCEPNGSYELSMAIDKYGDSNAVVSFILRSYYLKELDNMPYVAKSILFECRDDAISNISDLTSLDGRDSKDVKRSDIANLDDLKSFEEVAEEQEVVKPAQGSIRVFNDSPVNFTALPAISRAPVSGAVAPQAPNIVPSALTATPRSSIQIANTQKQLITVIAERDSNAKLLALAQKNVTILTAKVEDLKSTVKHLQADKDEAEKRSKAIRTEKEELQLKVNMLQEELKDMESDIDVFKLREQASVVLDKKNEALSTSALEKKFADEMTALRTQHAMEIARLCAANQEETVAKLKNELESVKEEKVILVRDLARRTSVFSSDLYGVMI